MIDTTFNLIVLSGKIFMSQIINHYPIETVDSIHRTCAEYKLNPLLINCFFNIEQLMRLWIADTYSQAALGYWEYDSSCNRSYLVVSCSSYKYYNIGGRSVLNNVIY